MQLTLDMQSTFLSMSCSTISGHIPHDAPDLSCTEISNSALQEDTYIQAAQKIALSLSSHPVWQQIMAHDNVCDDSN
jgi:hypothetical protein